MVSTLLAFGGGFAAGAVAGVVGLVLYFQYRTRKQLQQMEDQMGQLFDPDGMELDEDDLEL
ncbi:MAG: hypothetical protein SVU88_00855 [Candidatus Nanohaloarchaea archaeon]|nr:hypothetical protein [Candidatus Nanohaloarchaea archaeon]